MMMEEEMSGCCGFMGGMGLWYFGSMEDVWWRWCGNIRSFSVCILLYICYEKGIEYIWVS
jgi:hypothetical protein